MSGRAGLAVALGLAVLTGGCVGSSTSEVDAPTECVEAWRGARLAPTHCEEYPEAYQTIMKELRGD